MLPGAQYSAPEFSWKFEVAPGGIGFVEGSGLGAQFNGDLFMGGARDFLEGGYLFHFNLIGNRAMIGVDDPRLEDRVADNTHKFDITESESLLIGRDFGVVTDIETGPNGNLSTRSPGDRPNRKEEGMRRTIVMVLIAALAVLGLAPTAWAGDNFVAPLS